MSPDRIDSMMASAIAEGILPANSVRPAAVLRPWPVTLLTALGAWLAAVPLMLVLFLVFDSLLTKGAGPFIIGGIILGATIAALRAPALPLFLEQLALPALLVGGGMLGVGFANSMREREAIGILVVVACVAAALIPRNWLRTLLGAAACGMTIISISWDRGTELGWTALHLVLVVWLLGTVLVHSLSRNDNAGMAAAIDSFASGWALIMLSGLAIWSGMTFLAGASLGDMGDWGGGHAWLHPVQQAGSLALAAAGAALVGYRWPSMRTPWAVAAALVLAALAWLMPALGACLLALAVFATALNWRMAIAAALAAAWIVGAFYYSLSLPLATKSIIMVGAGAVLAAIAWFALAGKRVAIHRAGMTHGSRPATVGISACLLAVLAVANIGIWQKETLIAQGKPVFVELAPVDPRSLMQGDYMQLNFGLTRHAAAHLDDQYGERVTVIAKVDQRGVASFARLDTGGPLAAGEIRLALVPDKRGWKVASNAWYFKEGEAERWVPAKFGEFRVDASGRALLVGMRGSNLEPL